MITIKGDGFGGFKIEALSLSDDSWQDYKYFLKTAKKSDKDGEIRKKNRELRAGLLCLFAHLEAVVNYIYDVKNDELKSFKNQESLDKRTKHIGEIIKSKKIRLPYINFKEGKKMRNIIAHPDGKTKKGNEIDSRKIFNDLNVETLEELGLMIKDWLDVVCDYFKIARMMDSKKQVGNISEILFKNRNSKEI